ncbi:hypothetical protein P691DRAFT_777485 [Macrolepiota fuliginosa MF-IS2]|uniref:Uncharacterized protein n=1 Tax=Macrolepiota fuliginosa MF-IS2 TaxID=1400762 RepID=A0A9P6C1P3_9AGAR|nr:hypothetical protein P691DRAFT_777485 [Macrolepiota fuliginosa MF-IS2]
MSLLGFFGESRRRQTPARPIAATAKADAVSIHGHLSSSSLQGSIDSLAPAAHSRRRPTRAQTDSIASNFNSRNGSPSSSTTDLSYKPSSGWRTGAARVTATSLGDDTPSRASLAEYRDGDDARSHSRRSVLSRKTSTSLEQEWTDAEGGSSDEDDFASAHPDDLAPEAEGDQRPAAGKRLSGSVIMVEDEQNKARLLAEELSMAKGKLAEAVGQYSALQKQVKDLEKERHGLGVQLKALKQATDTERVETAHTHTAEMELKRLEIHKLQQALEPLQRSSNDKKEQMEMLFRENEALHKDVANLEKRNRKEEETLDMMKKEVEAANTALRSFRERSKTALEAEKEEKTKLKGQVEELQRQLGELQQQSQGRDEEMQRLRASGESRGNTFRKMETLVNEKDRMLDDFYRQITSLKQQREQLQEQLADQETAATEAKNCAQRQLARAKEDYQQELSLANENIQTLEEELSSYITAAEQLRSSANTSRADAESAGRLAEEHASEIERLNEELVTLEEILRAKDQEAVDSAASHASAAQLEDTISSLRENIDKIKAEHALELYKARNDIASVSTEAELQISRLDRDLSNAREKIRELRTRCDTSEQSRRMLRDQLSRREEESRKNRQDSSSSSSTIFSLNTLSSSMIREPAQQTPSTDQVYTLLQNLNYEIFQTAALLADSVCNVPRRTTDLSVSASDLIDDETTSLLGPYLLSLVRSKSTSTSDSPTSPSSPDDAFDISYDPYPLQTAIQATLVCCASRIMTAWYPAHWDHSDFLLATYTRIREAEGIAASEAWKNITRARLRPTTHTVLRVVDFLEECLSTIFRYAGWVSVPTTVGSSGSAAASPAPGTIEFILRENREKLSALARHSLRLNVILDTVQPQLEPALVEPGSAFDPHIMDREIGGISSTAARLRQRGEWDDADEEVVSTSEIGLRKVAEEGASSRGSSNRRRIVLKPKVILRSSFDST